MYAMVDSGTNPVQTEGSNDLAILARVRPQLLWLQVLQGEGAGLRPRGVRRVGANLRSFAVHGWLGGKKKTKRSNILSTCAFCDLRLRSFPIAEGRSSVRCRSICRSAPPAISPRSASRGTKALRKRRGEAWKTTRLVY